MNNSFPEPFGCVDCQVQENGVRYELQCSICKMFTNTVEYVYTIPIKVGYMLIRLSAHLFHCNHVWPYHHVSRFSDVTVVWCVTCLNSSRKAGYPILCYANFLRRWWNNGKKKELILFLYLCKIHYILMKFVIKLKNRRTVENNLDMLSVL